MNSSQPFLVVDINSTHHALDTTNSTTSTAIIINHTVSIRDPSVNGIYTWAGVASISSILCLLIYEFLRHRSSIRRILYTRLITMRNEAPRFPRNIFSWITLAMNIKESWIVENVGLDATM